MDLFLVWLVVVVVILSSALTQTHDAALGLAGIKVHFWSTDDDPLSKNVFLSQYVSVPRDSKFMCVVP